MIRILAFLLLLAAAQSTRADLGSALEAFEGLAHEEAVSDDFKAYDRIVEAWVAAPQIEKAARAVSFLESTLLHIRQAALENDEDRVRSGIQEVESLVASDLVVVGRGKSAASFRRAAQAHAAAWEVLDDDPYQDQDDLSYEMVRRGRQFIAIRAASEVPESVYDGTLLEGILPTEAPGLLLELSVKKGDAIVVEDRIVAIDVSRNATPLIDRFNSRFEGQTSKGSGFDAAEASPQPKGAGERDAEPPISGKTFGWVWVPILCALCGLAWLLYRRSGGHG